jgi:hypothetical protein
MPLYFRFFSVQTICGSISRKHGTKIISQIPFLMPQRIQKTWVVKCRNGEAKNIRTLGITQDCSVHQLIISICIYRLSGFRST